MLAVNGFHAPIADYEAGVLTEIALTLAG